MADDDEDDCMLIKAALLEQEFKGDLRFVDDGEELMDYLRHQGKYDDSSLSPRPDLILLDLNMPRKDGREALSEIKSEPSLRSIPVVILTTSSEEKDIAFCYDTGISSFITKPFLSEEWDNMVKAILAYWFGFSALPPKKK